MNLANSTMKKKKNSVPIVDFCESFVDVCKASSSSFCFNCCKVDNACLKSCLCSTGTVLEAVLFEVSHQFTLVMIIFLRGQMMGMIFICKSIPLSTNIFVSTILNLSVTECFISYESVMNSLEELFPCTSSSTGWPKSIPCLPAFYHIDVREVVPFLMTYSGIERRSIVYLMNC